MSTIEPFRLPESVPDCDCTLCLRKGVPLPIVEAPMMFAAYQIVKVDFETNIFAPYYLLLYLFASYHYMSFTSSSP